MRLIILPNAGAIDECVSDSVECIAMPRRAESRWVADYILQRMRDKASEKGARSDCPNPTRFRRASERARLCRPFVLGCATGGAIRSLA